MQIPFSKPHIPEQVYKNIQQVLASGKLSGDGPFCHATEKKLQEVLKASHVMLTTSGTHALEMGLLLLDAKPGAEVILPSFTFSSTANAVLMAGLTPIFCEIDPATFNMDMNDVAKKITKKTCAVIPVHYAGVSCDMERLRQLCVAQKIVIFEDAAQALGAKWRGKSLGTVGDMAAFSFHDTKNVICGEGGAFVTENPEYFEKAMIIREKGTNRSQFLRGQVDKYTWIEKGSSYVLAEPLAAILAAEVEIMDMLNAKRKNIYNFYVEKLKPLAQAGILQLPVIPKDCEANAHIFHIVLSTAEKRNSLMSALRGKGVGATFHYIPLHSAPAGRKLGYKAEDLPITEEYAARLLRLPLFPDMQQSEMEFVVQQIEVWAKA